MRGRLLGLVLALQGCCSQSCLLLRGSLSFLSSLTHLKQAAEPSEGSFPKMNTRQSGSYEVVNLNLYKIIILKIKNKKLDLSYKVLEWSSQLAQHLEQHQQSLISRKRRCLCAFQSECLKAPLSI